MAKDTRKMAFAYAFFIFAILTRVSIGLCDISGDASSDTVIASNQNNQSVALINKNNYSEPVISIKNTTRLYLDRYARFLTVSQGHFAPVKTIEDNEIDDKQDLNEEDPISPLYGIYKDCLFRLSFLCVQRKLLVSLDRFSRLKSFNIIGDLLSVVRTKREMGPIIKESELEARLNPEEASGTLFALMEHNVERFLQQHVVRITLPAGMTASVTTNARSFSPAASGNTIDINITRILEEVGRGKGDKKMKKLLGMLMTGLMGKMAFMGPFMVLLIKLKAMKALILSKIALMMSLFHLFKGKKGGGGGGHGKEVIIVHDTHGGGGGGGGGHDSYGSSGWASAGGGWSGGGGGGGGWLATHGDSYSNGAHTGGGDATYAGGDSYSTGHSTGGWAGGGGGGGVGGVGGVGAVGGGTHGWGRRSATDPHWVAYRAYIPDTDE